MGPFVCTTVLFKSILQSYVQGDNYKLCFFLIHCNVQTLNVEYKLIFTRNLSVQLLLLAGHFLNMTTSSPAVVARERWQNFENSWKNVYVHIKDLSILQYDVIFLSPDFLGKLRGFSKSFAYVGSVGSVAKGNIG